MPSAAIANSLAPFQTLLMGTRWTNQALPGSTTAQGSVGNPLSYNTMPLPQAPDSTDGYILKNCTVTEILQFNGDNEPAFPTTAPNRGSDSLQLPTALYYEQRVFFGDGTDGAGDGKPRNVVHTENGSWLNLTTGKALVGAYDTPAVTGSDSMIVKQMSVPHGNSILALGSYEPASTDSLQIPDADTLKTLPENFDKTPFMTPDPATNPKPMWAVNPNIPLQTAVELLKPTSWITWQVTTKEQDGRTGATMNIPFEQGNADVTDYAVTYWLMSTASGADGQPFYNFLAYSQNILLTLNLGGTEVPFSHWTSNVLTLDS